MNQYKCVRDGAAVFVGDLGVQRAGRRGRRLSGGDEVHSEQRKKKQEWRPTQHDVTSFTKEGDGKRFVAVRAMNSPSCKGGALPKPGEPCRGKPTTG